MVVYFAVYLVVAFVVALVIGSFIREGRRAR
jgi:hypothetical protein